MEVFIINMRKNNSITLCHINQMHDYLYYLELLILIIVTLMCQYQLLNIQSTISDIWSKLALLSYYILYIAQVKVYLSYLRILI